LLDYPRHFGLLLAAAAGLVIAGRVAAVLAPADLVGAGGITTEFAVCGALHALALAMSLKDRPSLGRQTAFVAVAAASSLSTAALSLALLRRIAWPGALLPILMAAAALGAWVYTATIRGVLKRSAGPRSAALIASACAAAVAAAYPLVRHFPRAFGLALAMAWWLAFSGALWARDAPRTPPGK